MFHQIVSNISVILSDKQVRISTEIYTYYNFNVIKILLGII